jgi:hypothetical protein
MPATGRKLSLSKSTSVRGGGSAQRRHVAGATTSESRIKNRGEDDRGVVKISWNIA